MIMRPKSSQLLQIASQSQKHVLIVLVDEKKKRKQLKRNSLKLVKSKAVVDDAILEMHSDVQLVLIQVYLHLSLEMKLNLRLLLKTKLRLKEKRLP